MSDSRRQRGANVLEAAFTIPIILLMVFGIVDLGRAYNVYQVITNAAREGARYSVAPAPGTSTLPSSAAVEAYVRDYLGSGSVKGATVNVTQTFTAPVNAIDTQCTEITVSVPYSFLFFPANVNISTRAVMRNETN
jgi:Flp pilus assembly protein TadG